MNVRLTEMRLLQLAGNLKVALIFKSRDSSLAFSLAFNNA
jgi:hypothetical protein